MFVIMTTDEKKEVMENHKKDAKALFAIQSGIDVSVFSKIAKSKTYKEACKILEST